MSIGTPASTDRAWQGPGTVAEDAAVVKTLKQRSALVRFLFPARPRNALVRAVQLLIVMQVLYLVKEGAIAIQASRSSPSVLLGYRQQEERHQLAQRSALWYPRQWNRTSVQTTAPPAGSPPLLFCTVGSRLPREALVYPADGLCSWIAYIHAGYNPGSETLEPTPEPGSIHSWFEFRSKVGVYNRTRLLPSLEWANFRKTPGESFNASRARSLNRTLVNIGMAGLSMLNVRAGVRDLRPLIRSLATLAGANPGMFLALGVRLLGLVDSTATRLVPAEVLDALLTPLSLFVLETHLPILEKKCVTAPLMPLFPYASQTRPTLTFRGVKAFFSQPVMRLIHPNATTRCVSLLAGAVRFRLVADAPADGNASTAAAPTKPRRSSWSRHVHLPGEPCYSWSVVPAQLICRQSHVAHIADAPAWYASSESSFFAFDTWDTFVRKTRHVLTEHLESEMPTCLALYSVDLEAPRVSCPHILGRNQALASYAMEVLRDLRGSQFGGASLFWNL